MVQGAEEAAWDAALAASQGQPAKPTVPVSGKKVTSAPAQPASSHTATPAGPAGSANRLRTVLYIEDNVVNQMLMEGFLNHRPAWRLLVAGLPEVGLTIALQSLPDLILLDIQLPGIDGFEVLRRLRAQPATQHIPVIAVSANAMPGDIEAALAAGFNDYLSKPLSIKGLLTTLDRALGL